MRHRLIYGNPLPKALVGKSVSVGGLVLLGMVVAAVGWFAAMLGNRRSRDAEEMVYVWPD